MISQKKLFNGQEQHSNFIFGRGNTSGGEWRMYKTYMG